MKAIIFDYNGVLNTGADIKETISKLSKDYKLFIASSSSLSNIKGLLEEQNLLKHFTEILGYDSSLSKLDKFKSLIKDHSLEPNDVIFITDTSGDILQAREAKIGHIIGILGGWQDKKTLARANPEIIVDNFQELPKEIKTLYK